MLCCGFGRDLPSGLTPAIHVLDTKVAIDPGWSRSVVAPPCSCLAGHLTLASSCHRARPTCCHWNPPGHRGRREVDHRPLLRGSFASCPATGTSPRSNQATLRASRHPTDNEIPCQPAQGVDTSVAMACRMYTIGQQRPRHPTLQIDPRAGSGKAGMADRFLRARVSPRPALVPDFPTEA